MGGSLGPWNRCSSAPRGVKPSSGRRCGSCGRPGARSPSTARFASGTRSSRSTVGRADRRGDAAAGPPARRRRGRDVRGHHDPGRRRWASTSSSSRASARSSREPVRSLAAVEKLRVPEPRGDGGADPRGDRDRAPRARARPGGRRLLRRAVHRRRLPRRGQAVARVRGHEDADVRASRRSGTRCSTSSPTRSRRTSVAQARAGADVVQLFDSWVGNLSPADYAEFVAPWSARVLAALRDAGVPTIHFGTGTATLLSDDGRGGGDVIGLDWRMPLDEGWARGRRGPRRAGQPRPGASCSGRGSASRRPRATCSRAPAGRPGHIFNLGHGVLPRTDPDVLGRVRELVHAETVDRGRTACAADRRPSGTPGLTARVAAAAGRPASRCPLYPRWL